MPPSAKATLHHALDRVERDIPTRLAKAVHWLRVPRRRWVRLPAGILFIIGGMFWFLPVVGIEMLPIGLALVAIDVPVLQRPMARMILWLDARWVKLRRRLKEQRASLGRK